MAAEVCPPASLPVPTPREAGLLWEVGLPHCPPGCSSFSVYTRLVVAHFTPRGKCDAARASVRMDRLCSLCRGSCDPRGVRPPFPAMRAAAEELTRQVGVLAAELQGSHAEIRTGPRRGSPPSCRIHPGGSGWGLPPHTEQWSPTYDVDRWFALPLAFLSNSLDHEDRQMFRVDGPFFTPDPSLCQRPGPVSSPPAISPRPVLRPGTTPDQPTA